MTFSVVQTNSDGTEVAWIDPTVEGQPEPQHPAPVLSLASAPSSSGSPAGSSASDGGTTNAPAGPALFLATLALVVGLAGAVLGWTARRRTVSS